MVIVEVVVVIVMVVVVVWVVLAVFVLMLVPSSLSLMQPIQREFLQLYSCGLDTNLLAALT